MKAFRSALCIFLASLGTILLIGCSHSASSVVPPADTPVVKESAQPIPAAPPIIRVRILQNQSQVLLSAREAPTAHLSSSAVSRRLNMTSANLTLGASGWNLGGVALGSGTLDLDPPSVGSVSINHTNYRGSYRFVPTGGGHFDVINDVEIDDYLKSVVSRELFKNWHIEAYRAQAIVARTYAIFEAQSSTPGRYYDLEDDQRSQAYGGIPSETEKSRQAVDGTRGIVVAAGPDGQEKIFKAYFSSCCGGTGQSAADAFGDPASPQLIEQKHTGWCQMSPKFNWRPVALTKPEIARRLRLWGAKHNEPERTMATLHHMEIQARNALGRPVRFLLTDSQGARYTMLAEEFRRAINADGAVLSSSFFRPVDQGNSIAFTDGHGFGHGVGMCQWCAESQAAHGMRHEDIVLLAYPGAKLIRAY